jgi:hypothetical protein
LWDNGDPTGTTIAPKNGKAIHLQNLPDREYEVDINSQAVKAQKLLKIRTLDAKPLTLDEQVISVGDLDQTTIKRNGEKIQAVIPESLWETSPPSAIKPKGGKNISVGGCSLMSSGLYTSGNPSRWLLGGAFGGTEPSGVDRYVHVWFDFDKNNFALAELPATAEEEE